MVKHVQENAVIALHVVPIASLRARSRAPAMQNAAQHVHQNAAIIPLVWIPAKLHVMPSPHVLGHVELDPLAYPHVPIPVRGLVKIPAKIPVIGPVSEHAQIPVLKLAQIHAATLVGALAAIPAMIHAVG